MHRSPRVVLAGAVLLALGLALASLTSSLLAFQLIFGVLVGGSAAAIFAPMMACVTGWFDTIAACRFARLRGYGHGTDDHGAARGLARFAQDWRTALMIIAVLVAAIMIPVRFSCAVHRR